MFELIMNIVLVVFLGFSYFTHVLEAPVPVKVQKNPYAFQPDTWPKVIIILAAASLLLETLGFVVTAILVLFFYGWLLGEKNMVRLAIASVCIALVLYIVFSGMLSVNLPRGTIGFLRNFALFLESIVAGVKGIFG